MLLPVVLLMLYVSLQLWQYVIQSYLFEGNPHIFLLLIGCFEVLRFFCLKQRHTLITLDALIVCTSSIVCSKSGSILYKAQSQDEDALVHAAALLHMVFVNKNSNTLGKRFWLLQQIGSTCWKDDIIFTNKLQRSSSMLLQFNMKPWKFWSSLLIGKECQQW